MSTHYATDRDGDDWRTLCGALVSETRRADGITKVADGMTYPGLPGAWSGLDYRRRRAAERAQQ